MDRMNDPLVKLLLSEAMKHRVRRTKDVVSRIVRLIGLKKCLTHQCDGSAVNNGNCIACDNRHRHAMRQITLTEGHEAARKYEDSKLRDGTRLAPGETIIFRRKASLERMAAS